jgi:hypothetical protein
MNVEQIFKLALEAYAPVPRTLEEYCKYEAIRGSVPIAERAAFDAELEQLDREYIALVAEQFEAPYYKAEYAAMVADTLAAGPLPYDGPEGIAS